jgi:flagellar motor protein MotB
MKKFVLVLMLAVSAFGQHTQAEKDKAQLAEYAKQEAIAQATRDKKAADEKAKAEVAAKLDNKNPQPVKKVEDQERISRLMLKAQDAQFKLQTVQIQIQQKVEQALKQPMADAESATKAFQDALAELQKSHHAEGCSLTVDKEWDCSKAGK